MKILIDNGHGIQTKGKRSPDGKFLEYAYTREIARQVVTELKNKGYDAELLVPEEDDIPLSERVRRTNAHCQAFGKTNVILISIHINAAGNGTKWMNATGWSCYTCKGQTESDRLADSLYKAAEQILENQVIRTDYARDGDSDWEENFYILRHSLCPAVLVEQFFMDNKKDLAYLISDEGERNLIDVIVGGLEAFYSLSFPFHEH
ncbi:MAG: N-acetylmuramoyl-L-alanine amidase [Candidatus Cryptobacteroides sp.]